MNKKEKVRDWRLQLWWRTLCRRGSCLIKPGTGDIRLYLW